MGIRDPKQWLAGISSEERELIPALLTAMKRGSEHSPISGASLFASMYNCDPPTHSYDKKLRRMRAVIRDLRIEGLPIASDKRGYWWASSQSELQSTTGAMRKVIQSLFVVVSSLEQVYDESNQTKLNL